MKLFKIGKVGFIGIIGFTWCTYGGPTSYPEAKKMYHEKPQELEGAKAAIFSYYQVGLDGLSSYERELGEIVAPYVDRFKEAWHKYTGNKIKTIIFDVDETCLSNIGLSKETNFTSAGGADVNYQFHVNKRCTAIKPIVSLCKTLVDLGYKLVFISARRGTQVRTDATRENLIQEGFKVWDEDGLFLMPEEIYYAGKQTQKWKESVRERLSLSHEIVGCVGDHVADITGKFIGDVTIKLPNYLY